MADERHEYEALVDIPDPVNSGRLAYSTGAAIHAQVVEDWGLVVGEHVKSLRPHELAPPAGNASRDDWARYRLAQGVPAAEVDELGRDALRDLDISHEGADESAGDEE